jgi:MoaA/NifB/PqqE/SkfB family radical SAM enzyme
MSAYHELKFLFDRGPSYFVFWVTQNCNFTCDHCFNYLENKKKNRDLSLEEIERISKNLGRLKYITFAGGEPFLRKDLHEVAGIFHRNNELQILNVVTNGWFTDRVVEFAKSVLKSCPGLSLAISCSLDGPREVHDRIRKKEGSFDQVMATLGALSELRAAPGGERLLLSVGGTYNADNATNLLEVSEEVSVRFKIPFLLSLIRGKDVQDPRLKNVDVEHYRDVAGRIARRNRELFSDTYPLRGARLALIETVSDIVYESSANDRRVVPCLAGKKAFVLAADGELILCEILDIRLGNVRDHGYDPMKILSSERARREIGTVARDRCHCTWECFQSVNAVYSPRAYPKILKHWIRNAWT